MSEADQSGAGRREVAYRLFAAEYDDADFSYSASDEERAPNYVVTPTGARVNRLFVVGVLTEVESVNDEMLRARVVDPTGAFVLYAGQYQPDELAFLESVDTPAFVAVTGKARTFQPDDSDQVFTSIRPETISEVDAETRDRWTVQTVEQTLDRIRWMATALTMDASGGELQDALLTEGADEGLAEGITLALDHYGTTGTYLEALQETALDAARLVAGERDEVESLDVAPHEAGEADLSGLTDFEAREPSEPQADESAGATPAPGEETETATQATESTASEPAIEESGLTGDSTSAQATDTTSETTVDSAADTTGETTADSTADTTGETTADTTGETTADSTADTAGETTADTTGETTADSTADTTGETTADSTADTAVDGAADTAGRPAAEAASSDESEAADEQTGTEEIGDFEPGEFDLDEDEREEIEEEYGTEFQTGTEVDEPGEADIDTPDPEETAEVDKSAAENETEASATGTAAEAQEPTVSEESEPDVDEIDLEERVVELMGELDDGDGAERTAVVQTVVEQHGVDASEVEDAIQDALMDGRCYEPDDDTLKPI
jgi:RPA family protein